jgi:molybdopterin converting factor small subunit
MTGAPAEAVTVLVPSALRTDVGGESRLQLVVHGTLQDVLRELDERWPRLARRISDEQGQLRKFVNVYVDGEDVRRLDGLATPVAAGAEVQILPSVAGGA